MRKQFHQENNRLEYGSLLYPMPGYQLSFAVGTTYSLDLEALLSVPVSFGVLESPEKETLNSPFVVLEAIQRCSHKVALFCQADGMKLPQAIRPVYALLENSIFPVNLGPGAYFHPKMWVMRYANGVGEEWIRVVILSRNLTFDRSLDVAVEMTGKLERNRKRMQKKHQPLHDFLRFLSEKADHPDKKREIAALAEDVLRVPRFDVDDSYEDYRFLPVGFPGYAGKAEGLFKDSDAVLIVSPFLSVSVLKKIKGTAGKSCLITRLASVTEEIFEQFPEVYVPVPGLENDNCLEEKEEEGAPKRDLHAKVIYRECDKGRYLYLGSLNATANAFYHNVEIMLELRFRPRAASFEQVKEDFTDGKNSAFQLLLHKPEAVSPEEGEEMEDFSDLVNAIKGAAVIQEKKGFCLEIFTDGTGGNAEIKPLFLKGDSYKELAEKTVFERLTVRELSELYAVRRNGQKRVLKIPTEGIPTEERDKAVFNSIIDSRPKFLQYVLFLLAEDPALAIVENDEYLRGLEGAEGERTQAVSPALYEKLLVTAAREPERLAVIRDVMTRVDSKHVDPKFREMLEVFTEAVERRSKNGGNGFSKGGSRKNSGSI